jgi:hypothetical protein
VVELADVLVDRLGSPIWVIVIAGCDDEFRIGS